MGPNPTAHSAFGTVSAKSNETLKNSRTDCEMRFAVMHYGPIVFEAWRLAGRVSSGGGWGRGGQQTRPDLKT